METRSDTRGFRALATMASLSALGALVGLCVWSASQAPLADGLVGLWLAPWGAATLTDLAVGLAVTAAWMVCVEANNRRLLVWLLLLPLVGNIATCLFLLARIRRVHNLRSWLTTRV